MIVADVLADGHVDDATAGIALIEAIGGDVASVTAHPAYDTIAIYEAAGARGYDRRGSIHQGGHRYAVFAR